MWPGKPQCTVSSLSLHGLSGVLSNRQRAKRDSKTKGQRDERPKGPRGQKGQEGQRAKYGQMTPREPPTGVEALQYGCSLTIVFLGEGSEPTNTEQPGKDGNRARNAIQGQLFERAPAPNWSSFQAIQSTMSFKFILDAVCDFKDNELKCSK